MDRRESALVELLYAGPELTLILGSRTSLPATGRAVKVVGASPNVVLELDQGVPLPPLKQEVYVTPFCLKHRIGQLLSDRRHETVEIGLGTAP